MTCVRVGISLNSNGSTMHCIKKLLTKSLLVFFLFEKETAVILLNKGCQIGNNYSIKV